MARNGVHSGGRTKAEYYKVWDKETGIYKGVWRIGARQRKKRGRTEIIKSAMKKRLLIQILQTLKDNVQLYATKYENR